MRGNGSGDDLLGAAGRGRTVGPPEAHVSPQSRVDALSRPTGHCRRQNAATGQQRARTGNDRQTKPARSDGLVKLWSTTQDAGGQVVPLCRHRRGYKNRNSETPRRKPPGHDPPCR
jgi:hypothetical protein